MKQPLATLAAAGVLLFAGAVAAQTAQKVSMASDAKAYRKDGARHLYATYKDQIYKGKLPPLIHAIVVAEVDLDAAGNVRGVQHDPHTQPRAGRHRPGARPDPARLAAAGAQAPGWHHATSRSGWSTRAAASSSTR